MHKFNTLRQIHLEISNNCQAGCPMCNRNVHGGLVNPLIKINNWTLDQFKSIMNHEVLDQIDSFYFCGNFGDPILNSDLIEMCEYASAYKPSLDIRVHTNGSAHLPEYWSRLARALPKNHRIMFALDGLEDTHHIYRVGTNFNKILDNARAFIDAGGQAEWVYIKFKHNEHQVEEARALSEKLGFAEFNLKNSARFVGTTQLDVVDKTGEKLYYIEPPTDSKLTYIDASTLRNYKKIVADSQINCAVIKTKEIYIDAFMNMYPCCFLASIPYSHIQLGESATRVRTDMRDQFNRFLDELGGMNNLNVFEHTVKGILNRPIWSTIWDKYWYDDKLITCARTCGTNKISKPMDQFINE